MAGILDWLESRFGPAPSLNERVNPIPNPTSYVGAPPDVTLPTDDPSWHGMPYPGMTDPTGLYGPRPPGFGAAGYAMPPYIAPNIPPSSLGPAANIPVNRPPPPPLPTSSIPMGMAGRGIPWYGPPMPPRFSGAFGLPASTPAGNIPQPGNASAGSGPIDPSIIARQKMTRHPAATATKAPVARRVPGPLADPSTVGGYRPMTGSAQSMGTYFPGGLGPRDPRNWASMLPGRYG